MSSEPPLYFDRQGKPISQAEACELFEHPERRSVAHDQLGEVILSTVHLVIDHNFHRGTEPLIFETMVFGGPRDCETRRYATEAQAKAGHDELLAELTQAQGVTLAEIELELAGLLAK